MEDLYSIHPGIPRSEEVTVAESPVHCLDSNDLRFHSGVAPVGGIHSVLHKNGHVPHVLSGPSCSGSDLSDLLKAQIASHPRYSALLSAYIECRKVGVPPEMDSLLEKIRCGNNPSAACGEIGADPELDEFMESYRRVLVRYKEELSKPFDEATSFLSSIQSQLSDLCKGTGAAGAGAPAAASTSTTTTATGTSAGCNSPYAEETGRSSDEDLSCEEESLNSGSRMGEQELKEMLLRKYRGYLNSLRKEFLKKRKKGKLPKSARMALLDWWNAHYRWPYPTDEEKARLAEITGLGQKQINNWFINQRKRHWKPSEDMRVALVEGVSGGSSVPTPWYFDTRTTGP